jgi:tRNA(Ile)-lysidine synthase
MEAIGQDEFAGLMARLGPWSSTRRVAIGVSGGADSMCLASLAAGWGNPLALIVDHRLRPDSTAEATLTASRLATRGIEARILTLHGLTPGPGLPARARAARYAALTQAANAAGLTDLLLAHHASDQAETLLMRRNAHSAPSGLAAMSAITETPALRLVRPLLTLPPGRLRATLRAHGIPWAEDPSNANTLALRTRLRQALADPDGDTPATAALVAEAGGHARNRAAAQTCLAAELAARATLFPEGHAILLPGPISADGLAALIRALSGSPYAPRGAALRRLAAQLSGPGSHAATLGGIRLMPAGRLGPGTLLVREPSAMQAPIEAANGTEWDRRFTLAVEGSLPAGTMIGALGEDAVGLPRHDLPHAVLCTLPALRAPCGAYAVPHLRHFYGWTNPSLRLTLTPLNPVAGASFHL